MAEYNLGTARGKIELDASQVSRSTGEARRDFQSLKSDLQNSPSTFSTVADSLDTMGGRIVSVFSTAAKVVGAAIGAVTGYSLWGGLQRVLDTEDARKLFGQMGSSAQEVDGILEGLNKTFEKSSFSYPDVYNVASQLKASGTALEDLNDQTRTVGDLAAFSNTEFSRVGDLVTKIGAMGRITSEELNSMASMGIPIRQVLADGLNITVDELGEMVSAGEVTSDMFHDIIGDTEMITGSMESMADTTRGAWETIKAGIAGAGQALLDPWFGENGDMVGFLQKVSDVIFQRVQPALAAFGDWLHTTGTEFIRGSLVPALRNLADIFTNTIVPAIQTAIEWFQNNEEAIGKVLAAVGPAAGIITGFATALHVLRSAWVLLQAATPIGLLLLLVSTLVYAWQNSETFRNIVTTAFEAVRDALGPIIEVVSGWIQGIAEWFAGTGDSATSMSDRIRAAWIAIQEFMEPLIGWFQEHVGPVFQALGELISAVWERVSEHFSTIWGFISSVMQSALLTLRGLWAKYGEPIGQVMSAMWEQAKNIVTTIWNVIKTIVETALGIITGIIQVATGLIRGNWSEVWEGIKTIFSNVWEGIQEVLEIAVAFITNSLENGLGFIRGIWNSAWEFVRNRFVEIWEKLQEKMAKIIEDVLEVVFGFKESITGFFSGAKDWLVEAGESIIQGLVDGIGNMVGKVTDAVGNVMSAARNLLPWSPAKEGPFSGKGWTLFSGRSIVDALAQGITDQEQQAVKAALRVANSVSGALSDPTLISSIGSNSNDLTKSFAGSGSALTPTNVDNSSSMVFSGDIILPNITDRSSAEDLLNSLTQAVRQGAR